MRHLPLGILLMSVAAGAGAAPVTAESFASCAAAQAAVAAAGHQGLRIEGKLDPIYADRSCYRDFLSDRFSVFPEQIRVDGQQCTIGYVCVRTTGGGADR